MMTHANFFKEMIKENLRKLKNVDNNSNLRSGTAEGLVLSCRPMRAE